VAGLLRLAGSAWLAMLAYHLGCGLVSLACGARPLARPRVRGLALSGMLSAVLVFVGCALLATRVAAFREPVDSWVRWGASPPADLALLAWYVAANPWIEEAFWRGAILGPRVRARIGGAGARALALLGFVPLHLAVLLPSFGVPLGLCLGAGILAASAAWTAIAERTGGFWWPAASHQGADLGLALAYWLWQRPD
jgi:hypothetical protein